MMGIFHVLINLSLTIFTTALAFDDHDKSYSVDVSLPSSSLNPSPLLLPPPPQVPFEPLKVNPFKPGVAVIVGVLTTLFSITFLILLYAKHCKRGGSYYYSSNNNGGFYRPAIMARKNSGIDPAVVDSLPIFRFGSLRGQKEGLECAVCLNAFESPEVLRLLPKCKHAFHVECIDTWLDAHSTCPLCRYRVDPEDVLLVDQPSFTRNRSFGPVNNDQLASASSPSPSSHEMHRIMSARHSEKGASSSSASASLQVIVEKPRNMNLTTSLTTRRSLDSWRSFNKKPTPTLFSSRRSLDSWRSFNRKSINGSNIEIGCLDRPRKDELLLMEQKKTSGGEEQRRLEHRIIISGMEDSGGAQERWSDVQPSDLLYLRSEMIMSDSRRFLGSRGSRSSVSRQGSNINNISNNSSSSRKLMKSDERCVSEMTGLSRFRSNEGQLSRQRQVRSGGGGVASRWLAWISQSHSHSQPPAVVGGGGGGGGGGSHAASSSSSSS